MSKEQLLEYILLKQMLMSGVKNAQFDIIDVGVTRNIRDGCVATTIPVFNIAVQTIIHHLHQHNTVMTGC